MEFRRYRFDASNLLRWMLCPMTEGGKSTPVQVNLRSVRMNRTVDGVCLALFSIDFNLIEVSQSLSANQC